MTHKIFEKLPDSNLPWFKTYTVDNFNWTQYSADVFKKDSAFRKAFNLPFDVHFTLETIAMTNASIIALLRQNENKYLDKPFIVQQALDLQRTLEGAWMQIELMPAYHFYYKNRESALSKEVDSILNIILSDI